MGQNPLKGYHIKERENKKESERDYDTSGDNRKLRASWTTSRSGQDARTPTEPQKEFSSSSQYIVDTLFFR